MYSSSITSVTSVTLVTHTLRDSELYNARNFGT